MSEAALGQVRQHPILAEFCDPLPRLIEAGTDDVAGSVSRFGELLGALGQSVSVGVQLIGDTPQYWGLQVGPEGSQVAEQPEDSAQPDIEIITDEPTWRRIAEGSLSPLAAMTGGTLRFRGDVVLASRVVHELRRADAAAG